MEQIPDTPLNTHKNRPDLYFAEFETWDSDDGPSFLKLLNLSEAANKPPSQIMSQFFFKFNFIQTLSNTTTKKLEEESCLDLSAAYLAALVWAFFLAMMISTSSL